MASQLGALFLRRLEFPVAMRDISYDALASARENIGPSCRSRSRRDGTTKARPASSPRSCLDLDRLRALRRLRSRARGGSSRPGLKKQVFAQLRDHAKPECILATNTSSLSVTAMGADVGIHFFDPVAVLPLVELRAHAPHRRRHARNGLGLRRAAPQAPSARQRRAAFVSSFLTRRSLCSWGLVIGGGAIVPLLLDAYRSPQWLDDADEAVLPRPSDWRRRAPLPRPSRGGRSLSTRSSPSISA